MLGTLLIFCHGGFRTGGALERLAVWVMILTAVTGVGGVVLQQLLPRLLTSRVRYEAPYDQIPHLCESMRREGDKVVDKAKADPKLDPEAVLVLEKFYRDRVRPFLGARFDPSNGLARPLQAESLFRRVRSLSGSEGVEGQLSRLQQCCEERRQLGEQERLHFLLHGWLLVHVPLSVALLLLGSAHALLSVFY
jgi:hypothetical protein